LNVTADLKLDMDDVDTLRRLSAVLAPDNEGLPRGLKLSMKGEGRSLRCQVESDSSSTAISTILALMRDMILFQEVWLLSRT
jgi:hypothetical protein